MYQRRAPGPGEAECFTLASHREPCRRDLQAAIDENGCDLDIEELETAFRELTELDDIFERPEFERLHQELVDLGDPIATLWNLTPQVRFGGRCPAELYLRELLLASRVPIDPDEHFGTGYVPSSYQQVLMDSGIFTPQFIAFVETERMRRMNRAVGTRGEWKRPGSGGR